MPKKIIMLLALLLSAPTAAFAHAAMVKSSPGARAELSQPPKQIELCFNEAVELKFSTVQLSLANKEAVALGALTLSEGPKCLAASAPDLEPGVYTVDFRVLSLDGHIVKSSFQFTVKPAPESR